MNSENFEIDLRTPIGKGEFSEVYYAVEKKLDMFLQLNDCQVKITTKKKKKKIICY